MLKPIRITEAVSKLIAEGKVFTDINVRQDMPIFYHSPEGYIPYPDFVATKDDISDLCDFAIGSKWEEVINRNDGQYDCGITVKGVVRLRCNFHRFGRDNMVGGVLRKLPITVPSIDDIGISLMLKRLIETRPKGLILVSGPTGSGKSTTIAAIIDYLNATRSLSIITLEQPIEYEYQPKRSIITQREIPTNVTTFKIGIDSSKRQDPDVIMVGEVRDKETVDAMLTAACSGHLVLATTHAGSAQESCESLLSYYSEEEAVQKRRLLASALLAINSQVLLPSKDKKSFVLGYELLISDGMVAKAIREGRDSEIGGLVGGQQKKQNIIPLNERLQRLVEEGKIDREVAVLNAYDKEGLVQRLMGR